MRLHWIAVGLRTPSSMEQLDGWLQAFYSCWHSGLQLVWPPSPLHSSSPSLDPLYARGRLLLVKMRRYRRRRALANVGSSVAECLSACLSLSFFLSLSLRCILFSKHSAWHWIIDEGVWDICSQSTVYGLLYPNSIVQSISLYHTTVILIFIYMAVYILVLCVN